MAEGTHRFVTDASEVGERLDLAMVRHFEGMSRAQARELIAAHQVTVNDAPCKKSQLLQERDEVVVCGPSRQRQFAPLANPKLTLSVVFEDPDLVVVNKAAGVDCHPLRESDTDTLVNGLVARYPEMQEIGYAKREAGLLHRLDRDTSGLVIAARNKKTFQRMREMNARDNIQKVYLALCEGKLQAPQGISYPLRPHPKNQRKVMVIKEGRVTDLHAHPAYTEVEQSRCMDEFSYVRVSIKRGARHQIRAHLAAIGHPIVSDQLYGSPLREDFTRHFLHAGELLFDHPGKGFALRLKAPLPEDSSNLLQRLGF